MIPAFQDAKSDRDLRGSPMTVYLHLLDILHPMEWRELKQIALGSQLGLSDRHLRRALDTLTARGYIQRQPIQPSSARLYRLVYSRIPSIAPDTVAPPTRD